VDIGGGKIDVVLTVGDNYFRDSLFHGFRFSHFDDFHLTTRDGKSVRLGSIADLSNTQNDNERARYKGMPTMLLTANLLPGADLAAARQRCREVIATNWAETWTAEGCRVLLWSEDPAEAPQVLP
jgi:multidrug efflux pump subunit AcrB